MDEELTRSVERLIDALRSRGTGAMESLLENLVCTHEVVSVELAKQWRNLVKEQIERSPPGPTRAAMQAFLGDIRQQASDLGLEFVNRDGFPVSIGIARRPAPPVLRFDVRDRNIQHVQRTRGHWVFSTPAELWEGVNVLPASMADRNAREIATTDRLPSDDDNEGMAVR